ncbi:MAG: glycosyltransferase family 2 protein [Cytophagales bacterium]|nr:glycosyltransferase family 2 protein [Cytophagales bacterium]
MNIPLSVIILTYNEERNLRDCILSILPLQAHIYIVDSGSTDHTINIAREYTAHIFTHVFENYAKQRNWALQNLPIATDWVLNMDADHRATPELIEEIKTLFAHGIPQDVVGYMASRRTMFMNKWIKHGGHYPTYHAILFHKKYGMCEDKNYDQHFVIMGKTPLLKSDMIDIITENIDTFITRHNRWAALEAQEVVNHTNNEDTLLIKSDPKGNPIEKRRYLKQKYYSYPIFVRVYIYFAIRYFVKLGFMDGKEGLIFHVLQGFWFRFLVDAKIYELLNQKNK